MATCYEQANHALNESGCEEMSYAHGLTEHAGLETLFLEKTQKASAKPVMHVLRSHCSFKIHISMRATCQAPRAAALIYVIP